jgi:hypothetical protein
MLSSNNPHLSDNMKFKYVNLIKLNSRAINSDFGYGMQEYNLYTSVTQLQLLILIIMVLFIIL